MTARKPVTAALLTLGVCAAVVALTAAPAWARRVETHMFSFAFGAPGSGAGGLALVSSSATHVQFQPSSGIAVNDATHDVYVADSDNHRVDEFAANGAFVWAWGWGVADGKEELETCTATCQAGVSGSNPGQLGEPAFVAVDNSPGGEGDVYVADTSDRAVTKFTSEGGLVESWGVKGQLDGSSATDGPFARPLGFFGYELSGIAVTPTGTLLVSVNTLAGEGESGAGKGFLFQFSQNGGAAPTLTPEKKKDEVQAGPLGIAVDGAGDFYLAGRPDRGRGGLQGNVVERSPSGVVLGAVDVGNSEISVVAEVSATTGFAVDTAAASTDLYVDVEGRSIEHFDSSCAPFGTSCTPADSFGSAEPVGGELSPLGRAEEVSGSGAVAVDPGTEAVYVVDTARQRVDVFVPTVVVYPEVATRRASSRTHTSAVLNGTVDPEGVALQECVFEYVTQAAFEETGFADLSSGGSAPCVPAAAGIAGDFKEHAVHAEVQGLQQGKTYDFRLGVANEFADLTGRAIGAGASFTAPAAPVFGETSVSGVTQTGASIAGSLNAQGLPTRYELRLGETRGALQFEEAGNTNSEALEGFAFSVGSLSPGTVYYYQLVAANPYETAQTVEGSFMTLPAPAVASIVVQGTSVPLLTLPKIAVVPERAVGGGLGASTKQTRARKLANALKACRKRPKSKRVACERQARKRYGSTTTRSGKGGHRP
jgi:DNA-binding beta-propeller fold protein YncE